MRSFICLSTVHLPFEFVSNPLPTLSHYQLPPLLHIYIYHCSKPIGSSLSVFVPLCLTINPVNGCERWDHIYPAICCSFGSAAVPLLIFSCCLSLVWLLLQLLSKTFDLFGFFSFSLTASVPNVTAVFCCSSFHSCPFQRFWFSAVFLGIKYLFLLLLSCSCAITQAAMFCDCCCLNRLFQLQLGFCFFNFERSLFLLLLCALVNFLLFFVICEVIWCRFGAFVSNCPDSFLRLLFAVFLSISRMLLSFLVLLLHILYHLLHFFRTILYLADATRETA
jgi:hypothetical protein